LLEQIARFGRPVILSTGMATVKEVGAAVRLIRKYNKSELALLQCTSNYPTNFGDVNLRGMITLRDLFRLPCGLSDHTPGIEVSVAAAALGAVIVEKHFTLDKAMPGPDHRASLDPEELGALVRSIRNVEKALGDGRKVPCRSELAVRPAARKSVVAAMDIPPGAVIIRDMLTVKRPGTGIPPGDLMKVVHRSARRSIRRDEVITWGKLS
jgi:N-acetylneuraminate synthase/N,N'-diacetyllegionaminate synthase